MRSSAACRRRDLGQQDAHAERTADHVIVFRQLQLPDAFGHFLFELFVGELDIGPERVVEHVRHGSAAADPCLTCSTTRSGPISSSPTNSSKRKWPNASGS